MFRSIGHLTYTYRKLILALGTAFIVFAAVWGTGVFGAMTNGGFDDPGSDSYKAAQRLDTGLGRGGADVVALYRSETLTVDDPAYRAAVTTALARLPEAKIASVASYYSTGAPTFVSTDRRATFAIVDLRGTEDEAETALAEIEPMLEVDGLSVQLGGNVPAGTAIGEAVTADIARAELLSNPILLVLLLFVFGGLAAASLPLAIGAIAVLGSFTVLRLLTLVTDVSTFAINIIVLLGLGLAIDYALFIITRFREELPQSPTVEAALVRTMTTAGRTVAFSGLTVAISLSSLLIFPQVFLRSMGFGGMAAVLVAMVASLTILPALLAVLGHRVNALFIRRLIRRGRPVATGETHHGVWYRVAHSVMRRPVLYVVVIVLALGVMGSPFLRAQFSTPDASVLPAGNEARVVSERLDREFARNEISPIQLAIQTSGDARSPENIGRLYDYTETLAAVPGVRRVDSVTTLAPNLDRQASVGLLSGPAAASNPRLAAGIQNRAQGTTTSLDVLYDAPAQSDAARTLVDRIRAVPAPEGMSVLVGGETAGLVDLLATLRDLLPVMALIIICTTFVLLFLAFGSVVLPLKAVLMNILSLSASFGALVWIFQDGHFEGLLGFTANGTIDATQPILMLAIAFGLSMDYEVFLLSRIKEQYDRTGDNTGSVALGLQRTGAIITSAALLLMIVIGAFSTSGIVFIKMIGVGMFIAIFVDATVVRGLLVPATMQLMGNANWWAPRPLRWVYERFGLNETETPHHMPNSSPIPRGTQATK
ncbi:MAG: MMPL family transporter [Chloroflexia bacterium]|nr:MMPL family transporter [Chloroflexia bacterium]